MPPTHFIDTHCHLDAAEFALDRDDVVVLAVAAGVVTQIIPAVSVGSCADVADVCERFPGCLPAWGIHPMYVDGHTHDDIGRLRQRVELYRPVAIGEIGLDLFVEGLDIAAQEFFFVEQLKLAKDFNLPALLHCRRANDLILKHLRRFKLRGGIAHAFSGSRQQAEEFLKLGFKLGMGGAFTWERATRLRALARELPIEAIVLETDSPDIPPAWLNKGRNEPAELARIATVLAELRVMSVEEVARATSENARAVLPGLPI